MSWVYNHYKYVYSYSAGIDFRRQILTTKVDPRTVRVKKYKNVNRKLTYFNLIAEMLPI